LFLLASLITPERKPQFYPKSHLTPSLFSFVIISKYVDHLPLYRIEYMLKRLGADISRATLCNWVIGVYQLYKHLFSFLTDHLKTGFLIGCDETKLQVLLYMKRLYKVERIIKKAKLYESDKFKHIVKIRQRLSAKYMDKIHKLLIINKDKLLSSKSLEMAIKYTLNNWNKLTVFLSNAHVPISNILVENNIRPVALGRKNWLFSVSPKGAEASAFFYSIIETFKANKIDPDKGFRELIEQLPNCETPKEAKKVFEKILGWA
jgi:hypothetical protein